MQAHGQDTDGHNHLVMAVVLLERQPLRYTPGGVPLVRLRLGHRSRQRELGIEREVELELPAVAAGDLARRMDTLPVGCRLTVSGFLARTHRTARLLALHITNLEPLQD